MATKIDSEGSYRGPIREAAVSTTKKGFPQLVVRMEAAEKYIESSAEMEHFEIDEPGWVDWSAYGEDIIGYFVLCNDEKPLLNMEQVMKATGWDGSSFAALDAMDLEGHIVQFRVAENEYDGQVRMQAEWIDEADAPLNRELSSLDSDKLKDLDSKFKSFMTDKKAAPKAAKPAAKGKTKAKAKDESKKEAEPKSKTKAKPKAKAAPPTSSKPPAKAEEEVSDKDIPFDASKTVFGEVSDNNDEAKVEVWTHVCENDNDAGTDAVSDAWIAASREVGGDREESEFTSDDWVRVGLAVRESLGFDD